MTRKLLMLTGAVAFAGALAYMAVPAYAHHSFAATYFEDKTESVEGDLVQFYGACDLFVFPSFYEGFGLPILEAMACGRAVACSDVVSRARKARPNSAIVIA